jgi:hypothetical protein
MPLPPVSNPFPPPWEKGAGPADPAISAIATVIYASTGYAVPRYQSTPRAPYSSIQPPPLSPF